MLSKNDWIKKETKKVKCNCGGPQYGTDHSPDCELVLAWEDAQAEYEDYVYQQQS